MKITSKKFMGSLLVLGTVFSFTSCSQKDSISGTWEGNPTRLTEVKNASDASATVTMNFTPGVKDKSSGTVNLTAVIEVSQASNDIFSVGEDQPYQYNIAATASISGTYTPEEDEDDDYILSLDPTTLSVKIDPDGVAYTTNTLTDEQQPLTDSLTAVTINNWKLILTGVMRDEFNKYVKIEDVKIHHKDIMSAEINDRDYTFRRFGSLPTAE